MTNAKLKYNLNDGFIHNWLVAGPLEIPLTDNQTVLDNQRRLEIIRRDYKTEAGITEIPVDLGSLGPVTQANPAITWRYLRCREDHFIDFTSYYASCHLLRSWAYTQVVVPDGCEIVINLATNTPLDFWLNGRHQIRLEEFHAHTLTSTSMPIQLGSGVNEFLFRLENVGVRATSSVLALRLQGVSDNAVNVVIPTNIEPQLLEYRTRIEELITQAYLDRYVYGDLWGDRYNKNQPIPLKFSSYTGVFAELTVRLQSLTGNIFQEGTKQFGPGSCHEFAKLFPLRNGPHHLAIMPPANEYYIKKTRVDRKDLFYVVRTSYSQNPYGTTKQRAKEALVDASQRRNESVFCEIAKIANGQWKQIDRDIFTKCIKSIEQREDGSVHSLLGIIGLMFRYRKSEKISKDLKAQLKTAILNYRYWHDEPNLDGMDFETDAEQILFHTCETLAGQLFPNTTFPNLGKKGQWHNDHGEALAIDWLRQHGQFGFVEWDHPGGFELILAALSHLVDLASSDTICELAAVLMDKIFFTMAINSFQGAFGSTRGRTDTASVLSTRLEPTSGIFRLMWGMGNFNESIIGTVSLACCKNYELPEIIKKIGQETPTAFWNREHQGGGVQSFKSAGVDKVTYRTKDFLLGSAQDYKPGENGAQEHIWQATLGPDSIVYVNHPVCMSDDECHQPNLWRGNGILPRVAQWGDVLVSVHKLPQDDWMGFTHAYFPAVTFDDYQFQDKWAFARKGDAYIALCAANGFTFIQKGPTAYRELRSPGNENIWVCHMGQKLLDGSFDDFQQKVLGITIRVDSLCVSFNSLRGDTISFGWDGPFWVNDQEQGITGFRHYENTYCIADLPATQMEIVYQDEGLRLNFE